MNAQVVEFPEQILRHVHDSRKYTDLMSQLRPTEIQTLLLILDWLEEGIREDRRTARSANSQPPPSPQRTDDEQPNPSH